LETTIMVFTKKARKDINGWPTIQAHMLTLFKNSI
jgi:hypothetical protein